MDELDLVRLTRPPVDDLGEDALARVRAAALGAAVDPPATDAEPVLAVVDLTPAANGDRRGWWRLASAGVAAAALVAGGLAIAARRGGEGGAASSTDATLRRQLSGQWSSTADLPTTPSDTGSFLLRRGLSLNFSGEADAVTLEGPCGTFVSRGYDVVAGALVLDEPLTSPEGACTDPAANDAIVGWLGVLSGRPTLTFAGCGDDGVSDGPASCQELRFAGSDTTFTHQPDVADVAAPATSAITSPSTTIAFAHTPTIDELRGRTFQVTALRQDATGVPLARTPTLAFGDRVSLRTVCNVGSVSATVVDGRLFLTDYVTTAAACAGDGELMALLLGSPRITIAGSSILLVADGYDAQLEEGDGTPASPTTSIGLAPPSTFVAMPTTALEE